MFQLLVVDERILDVIFLEEQLDKISDGQIREKIRGFIDESWLTTNEMIHEGDFSQSRFDADDDIGIACGFLENVRNGEYADLFCLISNELLEEEN